MMRLMSLKQYMKMSKPALIRKITKSLRAMPKVKLARLCYNITKSKLPRLKTIKRKRTRRNLGFLRGEKPANVSQAEWDGTEGWQRMEHFSSMFPFDKEYKPEGLFRFKGAKMKRKALPKPKKKKEKLTKAEKKRRQKKLSALNKWREEQGMKRIVIK